MYFQWRITIWYTQHTWHGSEQRHLSSSSLQTSLLIPFFATVQVLQYYTGTVLGTAAGHLEWCSLRCVHVVVTVIELPHTGNRTHPLKDGLTFTYIAVQQQSAHSLFALEILLPNMLNSHKYIHTYVLTGLLYWVVCTYHSWRCLHMDDDAQWYCSIITLIGNASLIYVCFHKNVILFVTGHGLSTFTFLDHFCRQYT